MAAYIVCLEKLSLLLYHIDSLGMIPDIQPVTDILSVTINRELLALKRIIDNKRDKLLRELVRSIVIGAVCYIGREMICIHICSYQHIGSCLAC